MKTPTAVISRDKSKHHVIPRQVEIMDVGAEPSVIPFAPGTRSRQGKSIEGKQSGSSSGKKAVRFISDLGVTVFHTPEGEPFASFPINNHWETYSLEDSAFKQFFGRKYYEHHEAVLPDKQFSEFLNILIGKAKFAGPEQRIYVRVAESDGAVYVDLGNESWEVVKITIDGWEIVAKSPVRFRRTKGMKALPRPAKGGSIETLRQYLNLATEDDWKLVIAWLIAALRPNGPYPILVFEGGQGTAKSTNAKVCKSLIDPSAAPLRSAPPNDRELMIMARNSWNLALENLSSVPLQLSDALCRLATGSGLSTRQLYTDADEKVFEASRPVILNGIQVGLKNGDVLERSVMLTLPPISDENRIPEADFWRRFEEDQPAILGALFDAVACALKRLSQIKLSKLPRMADFAQWVTAAEPAFEWEDGSFLEAYNRNRQTTSAMAADSSPLTQAIEKLLSGDAWRGTATELLEALNNAQWNPYSGGSHFPKGWPQTPNTLSGMLRRLEPDLKSVGIQLDLSQTSGANSRKIITLRRLRETGAAARKAS